MGMDRNKSKNFDELSAMSDADCRKLIIKNEDTFRKTLPKCKLPVETITAAALLQKLQTDQTTKGDPDKAFVEYFKSVTPVFSAQTFTQVDAFVKDRQKNGSPTEQKHYTEQCKSAADMMCRLYEKKPYACYGHSQTTLCANDETVRVENAFALQNIGSSQENSFFCLTNFLSIAEGKFSQQCGLTCKVRFINSGHKLNKGQERHGGIDYQPEGYITVIGTVDHNIPTMIHDNYIRKQDDNSKEGDLVIKKEYFDQTKLIQNHKLELLVGQVFNAIDFKKTIKKSLFDALNDANNRAKELQKQLYYQMPAFNSNEWFPFNQKNEDISNLITRCFLEVIVEIAQSNTLDHIAVINCSAVASNAESVYKDLNIDLNDCRTKIVMAARNPSTQLTGQNAGLLLHTLCLSNGFSLIGNRLWAANTGDRNQFLTSSEETAAACSSYISSIMNPKINPFVIAAVRKQAEICQAQLAKKIDSQEESKQPIPAQKQAPLAAQVLKGDVAGQKATLPNPVPLMPQPGDSVNHTPKVTPEQPGQASIATPDQAAIAITTQKNAVAQLLTRAQALQNQDQHTELINKITTMQTTLENATTHDQNNDTTITNIIGEINKIEQEQLSSTQTPQKEASFSTTRIVLGGIASLTAVGGMLYYFGVPTVLSTMWNNLSLPNPQDLWQRFMTSISSWLPQSNESSSFTISEW